MVVQCSMTYKERIPRVLVVHQIQEYLDVPPSALATQSVIEGEAQTRIKYLDGLPVSKTLSQ